MNNSMTNKKGINNMTISREKWFNNLSTEEKIIRNEIKKIKKSIKYQKTNIYSLLFELKEIDKRKQNCQYYDERTEKILTEELKMTFQRIKKYKAIKKALCNFVKKQ